MFKNLVLQLLLMSGMSLEAQFIATYSFELVNTTSGTTDPSPVPLVQGLLLGPCKATGVSQNSSASGRFAFTAWPLGAGDGQDDFSQFSGALSGFSYYELGIKVQPGYTLTLNSLSFGMRRTSTGPRNYAVRGSADNFNTNLAAQTGTNAKLMVLPGNIFFWKYDSVSVSSDQKESLINPAPAYQAITDSVSFRIYAWNAEATGGSFSVDNLSLNGIVTSGSGVGINEHALSSTMVFYNTLNGKLVYKGLDPCTRITVVNLEGRQNVFLAEKESGEILLPELPNGVYFIVIPGKTPKKLVIER